MSEELIERCRPLSREELRVSLRHIYLLNERVFRCTTFGPHLDGKKASCGEVIQMLMSICLAGPEFLTGEDAARHIAFLHDLECMKAREWRSEELVEVANLPFHSLRRVLENWIFSFFEDNRSQLLPHYALDTAVFIEKMANGFHDNNPEPWRVEPILNLDSDGRDLYQFLDSPFKRKFTQQIYLVVSGTIPESVQITRFDQLVFKGGDEFCFGVTRCHLSASFYDYNTLQVNGSSTRPRFDLCSEFRLIGSFLSSDGLEPLFRDRELFALPLEWVARELRFNESDGSRLWFSAPRWLPTSQVSN